MIDISGYVWPAISAVVVALSGAVAYLWRDYKKVTGDMITDHESRFQEVKTKLDECEDDRQELWRTIAEIRK